MLGLTTATVDDTEVVVVADGRAAGGQIHHLDRSDGSILHSFPGADVPLDVVVDAQGQHFVLASATSNPLIDKDPVWLRRYDRDGTETELTLSGEVYLDLGSDGVLYVSSSDFDQATRRIIAVDRDLATQEITELPESYEGYSGGIATVGSGR